jgi:hypothetical protein
VLQLSCCNSPAHALVWPPQWAVRAFVHRRCRTQGLHDPFDISRRGDAGVVACLRRGADGADDRGSGALLSMDYISVNATELIGKREMGLIRDHAIPLGVLREMIRALSDGSDPSQLVPAVT